MIQIEWKHIIEMNQILCHTIQMELKEYENLEVQAKATFYGQLKEPCKAGIVKGIFMEHQFQ